MGLKKKKVTCLAILREDKEDSTKETMLEEIKGVLNEFNDAMLLELSKRLPLRIKEDHKIELNSRVKPHALGSYMMALLELDDLRR